MRHWRYALCGVVALVIGLVLGAIIGSVLIGLVVTLLVSLLGAYMVWESGAQGRDAGQLTAEEEPGDERYAGGYAGFHDGGGGGMG